MEKKIIELKNVDFSFSEEHKIIRNAVLTINSGDFVAIVGPNGGGKTTLVNLILGVLKPDKGTVILFGKDPKFSDKSRIGFVPQNASNFDYNFPGTVAEIAATGLIPNKKMFSSISSDELRYVDGILKSVGMLAYKTKRIGDLSGGQKQRVFIARALANNPDLLILDEPTIGVDASSQKEFFSLLNSLNKNNGTTIVIISHDTSTVSKYVNKIVCVNQDVTVHSAETDTKATCGFSHIHKHIIHKHS